MSKLQWDRRSDDVVSPDPQVPTMDRRASATTHGGDFFLWANEQALALSEGRWDALDVANLVDEVHDLGRSQKREISSRTTVLLQHLLKWKFQPKGRSSSWRGTIREQRRALNEELDDSPSLRPYALEQISKTYNIARDKAAGETELNPDIFPDACPFTMDELLDDSFYPEET
ncbi:MAG: DUF29 domain-containing protein [Pseudomonadota bacterium]|nr:DUF29 domain-containing protein [Pseudomonadota bacterium]